MLDLLNVAFGFAGAPGAGENALAAPQAALISALAQGVFGGSLNWGLLGLGAAIGAVVIVIDELLGRFTKLRLPPLAVDITEPKTTPMTSATCCFQGVAPTSWPVLRSCRLSLEIVATLNTIAVVKSA